ncbi:MAG: Rieske 2Fe-2S domain-containing protein [Deltaproteobacteria bacterium]|nr:Rieske 2Fe-2S domain-containing protein [Deltaproteobacteria bacterium]
MHRLDIDPDLALARTPPAWLYTDRAVHEVLRRRVWRPGWTLLLEPPAAKDATLVPCDLSGEPAVLVRDDAGERLLSNVCTHRAATILDAPCRGEILRCPYHGRRFRTDGSVAAAPGFDAALGPDDALPRFASSSVGPLSFGALEPGLPFDAWWAPIDEALGFAGRSADELRYDPRGDITHDLDVPWLLYLENYLEAFHIPFVHPELSRTLSLENYEHELFAHGTLQLGIAREEQAAFLPTYGRHAGKRVGAFWFWLWPATLVNVYPWGLSMNRIDDAGFGRARIHYRAFVWDESLRGVGAGGALDIVEQQDQSVARRAWSGLQGSTYRRGRYSPTHERGLHHFHRLLEDALG